MGRLSRLDGENVEEINDAHRLSKRITCSWKKILFCSCSFVAMAFEEALCLNWFPMGCPEVDRKEAGPYKYFVLTQANRKKMLSPELWLKVVVFPK
jgi:hypothetical protein